MIGQLQRNLDYAHAQSFDPEVLKELSSSCRPPTTCSTGSGWAYFQQSISSFFGVDGPSKSETEEEDPNAPRRSKKKFRFQSPSSF